MDCQHTAVSLNVEMYMNGRSIVEYFCGFMLTVHVLEHSSDRTCCGPKQVCRLRLVAGHTHLIDQLLNV